MKTDRAKALPLLHADAATLARYDDYVDLLARWRKVTNLISESTFTEVWTRHIADCAQLRAYAPNALRWLDLGSGAGFPGLVIAIQLADRPGAVVHCIEADQRKCAFLREVARATGAPARIHASRIEAVDAGALGPVDSVTSRALAALPDLLNFARPWLAAGAIGVFPRGRTAERQTQGLDAESEFQIERFASKVDPQSQILRVRPRESLSP